MSISKSRVLHRSLRETPPKAVGGEGVWLIGEDGRRILDASGGAAVSCLGHQHPRVLEAMSRQASKLAYAHTSFFSSEPAEALADNLVGHEPGGLGYAYLVSGGSEAIETALKLARQFQVEVREKERFRIISRRQSYHGSTLGALAVSGNLRRREIYLPMVRGFEQIDTPYCYRCKYLCTNCGQQYANELDMVLGRVEKEVAAFILEPMSGATLGAVVSPSGYLPRVAEICSKRNVLLIADEVMTGMGRTGRNFAVEHWGIQPDILVTAKGLSSGYSPLGAVIASPRVVDAIANGSGSFIHGFTYNAHPVCLAAGRAVLRRIRDQKLVAAAATNGEVGASLASELKKLSAAQAVGEVRGLGMLWGVEFVADRKTKKPFPIDLNFAGRVGQACAKRGLLVYPMQGCVDGYSGDHLLIAPPAIISAAQVRWAVEQLQAAIEDVNSSSAKGGQLRLSSPGTSVTVDPADKA